MSAVPDPATDMACSLSIFSSLSLHFLAQLCFSFVSIIFLAITESEFLWFCFLLLLAIMSWSTVSAVGQKFYLFIYLFIFEDDDRPL